MTPKRKLLVGGLVAAASVTAYDLSQRRHAILRNFPLVGHLRFLLEAVGPELRQYIVTDNDEERPFTRDQRRWIYASAKAEDTRFGFGTDNRLDQARDYPIVRHRAFVRDGARDSAAAIIDSGARLSVPGNDAPLACAKVIGGPTGRRHAFRPASVVNISAMSFGSLSGAAIRALNLGADIAGVLHNTGEGGVSPHHRQGADLVLQVGTSYFGCRAPDGGFDLDRLADLVGSAPIRAIEVKLSQGAKPGLGGLLPGAKVNEEVARVRGIPVGEDCISPPRHSAFGDVAGLIRFVERIAERTGLPVGIKSAVGESDFWEELAAEMKRAGGGPDFITIDGGEGGTGAAPMVFADHVALPVFPGLARAYGAFARNGLQHEVTWIASGRLGLPERAMLAFALGADMINVAREAMLAIGCIQAQRCHTGRCPTGVTTHGGWLERGLDPADKSVRVARYIGSLRYEIARLCTAVGVSHPSQVGLDDMEILDDSFRPRDLLSVFGYDPGWV